MIYLVEVAFNGECGVLVNADSIEEAKYKAVCELRNADLIASTVIDINSVNNVEELYSL